jgi:hypothetical protein
MILLLGFNEDESGKKVVDGIINWIDGASGICTSYRFAQSFRTYRQHINRWFPEFQAPFSNQARFDLPGLTSRAVDAMFCKRHLSQNFRGELGKRVLGKGYGGGRH